MDAEILTVLRMMLVEQALIAVFVILIWTKRS